MKKIKYLIITLLTFLPFSVKAAVIHCSAPSTVTSGDTFDVTFSGSLSSDASLWIASIGSSGNASFVSGNLKIVTESRNMSQTVTYKAGNAGTASFYAYDVDVSDGENSYDDSDTCYVTITEPVKQSEPSYYYDYDEEDDEEETNETPKSNDNYLKILEIENVKITPAFSKDRTLYSTIVKGTTEKIVIKGEANDSKAKVEGIGEKELKEGINKFEIVVTAEDGSKKTYTLNVTRKEKNPIEVTIDKKKYFVVKKDITLSIPKGYVKESIEINNEKVEAYINKKSNYTLVALIDENGKTGWFKYNSNNSTYTKYNEFSSSEIRLEILKAKKKDIPHKYYELEFNIGNEEITGYALEYNSPFRLIYAMNIDTGEKGFYLYNMDDNTFQKFYNVQTDIYRSLVKKLEVVIISLLGLILILFIIIITQKSVNRKMKKVLKGDYKKEEPKSEIKKEEPKIDERKEQNISKTKKLSNTKKLENTKTLNKTSKIDKVNTEIINTASLVKVEEPKLSKKEEKRLKKEEKKALAEARKEFFD